MASDGILLGEGKGDGEPQEQIAKPRLIIEFQGPGSALFTTREEGTIAPTQKLALASFLEMLGKLELQQIMAAQQQQAQQQMQMMSRLQGIRH